MENYETLLNEAYNKIKPVVTKRDRFEVPRAEGHFEGNKTVLTNIPSIVSYIRRDMEHFLKYFLKELATSGKFDGNRVILQTKIPSSKVNEKICQYVEEFVVCKECKKPDTELIREKGFLFIHCLACGAKHSVRSKI